MQIRVYYEDTDAGGIVYHSNYLNFCERARSEYFFRDKSNPLSSEGGFVVSSLEAKFKVPSRLGDLLDVKTEVVQLKTSSLTLYQSVFKDDVLLFEMNIKLAFVCDSKITRMKPEFKEYICKIFEQGNEND